MGNSPTVTLDKSTLQPAGGAQPITLDKKTLAPVPMERAMQQTMGGPPMFVSVPQGQGAAFERAGKEGYTTGGIVGAGAVAGAALGGAAAATPEGAAVANYLINAVKNHPIASTWVATHLADYLGIPLPKVVKAIAGIREVAE